MEQTKIFASFVLKVFGRQKIRYTIALRTAEQCRIYDFALCLQRFYTKIFKHILEFACMCGCLYEGRRMQKWSMNNVIPENLRNRWQFIINSPLPRREPRNDESAQQYISIVGRRHVYTRCIYRWSLIWRVAAAPIWGTRERRQYRAIGNDSCVVPRSEKSTELFRYYMLLASWKMWWLIL